MIVKSLVNHLNVSVSVYQLLKRNFSLGYSLYFIECFEVPWCLIVSKCQNECGRMLNPLLLPLCSLLADHHGEAAEGDIPGLAQLPGADHGALQLCEFGASPLLSWQGTLSFSFFQKVIKQMLHANFIMTVLED